MTERWRWLHWLLGLAIIGGLGLAAAKYLHGAAVAAALARFHWLYGVPILLFSSLYLLLKAGWFAMAVQALCAVRPGVVARAYLAGQPATLLPGGIAARLGLLAEVGVPAASSAAPVLLNSLLDQLCFLSLALVAGLWYAQARAATLGILGVMLLFAGALAVPQSRNWLGRAGKALAGRLRLARQWERFIQALTEVACPRILLSGYGLTLAAKLLLVYILALCLRSIGLSAHYPALLLATTLPTVLGRLTPLPAGIGPTEAAMVGLLGSAAGLQADDATAGVALFRLTTVVYQALFGAVVYFIFWHGERESRSLGTVLSPTPRPGG
jgi:uncharacterized membrane protein YbhN (UPF0104 family)